MDLRIAKRIRAGRRAMIVVIKRQLRALGTALTLPSDYEQSRQATPLGTHHPTSGREAHSAEPAGPTFRRTQSLGAMRPDGGAERPAASPPLCTVGGRRPLRVADHEQSRGLRRRRPPLLPKAPAPGKASIKYQWRDRTLYLPVRPGLIFRFRA